MLLAENILGDNYEKNFTYTNATVCNINNKLIGFLIDGYPVYSQRDANGNVPTKSFF